MKHILSRKNQVVAFVALMFLGFNAMAQTGSLVAEVEAEDGVLNGVRIENSIAGYSGSGYVTGFDSNADKVTVTVSVPTKAFYQIVIRYHSQDFKSQKLIVNGGGSVDMDFQPSVGFADANGGKHILNSGENTIAIENSWGWTEIDKFSIYTTTTNSYENLTYNLVDSKATASSKALYYFLLSQYGKRIISGQTDNYFSELTAIAGKTPLHRVWDFQHYTEGYPYNWEDGGFAFGIDTDAQDTENAIAWYNSTGRKGIVGFQWHWHSPSGGTVGTNTFYNEYTTFDVKKAVIEGTNEYSLAIRDIDAIAVELKKLENANVPVIFRPLHEAGGGWFWWSGNTDAASAAACVKLYEIIFDRIVNHHQIHNLIWAWSSYEEEFYPGNDKVDIVGMDSYPGVYNYATQKNTFDRYFELTNGEKIVTMTENGPIPDPDDCLDLDAPWSYFVSWGDLVSAQNEASHIRSVFENPNVLTLESYTFPVITSFENAFLSESGIATLKAEANFGTVNWYETPTGGSPLHTGTTFTTPELSETTVYYVEATNNGQSSGSARIKVTATSGGLTAIKNIESNKDIKIYPNPVENILELNVSGVEDGKVVKIYNINGEVVAVTNIQNSNILLNQQLMKGIYLLVVEGYGQYKLMVK